MAKAVEDDTGKRGLRASADKVHRKERALRSADRDIVMLGIVVAAIILFVGTGGTVMRRIVQAWGTVGDSPDSALANAVLLNIALLVFGWRRYRALQQEVADRRKAEEMARELAETDPLTGCLNRRSGAPAIQALLDEGRASGRDVCVLMVDIDTFKQINDVNGHQAGDMVLQTVARRLREVLPAGSPLARIGGDEFACVVLHDRGQTDAMEALAAEMITVVSAPIERSEGNLEATISLGLASTAQVAPQDPIDAEMLLHRADIAMYEAKKCGRNRHRWYEVQLEDELRFRNELEAAIRHGIQAGEFVPYYEQQVDLKSGELTGFEMLARWNSPRYGLVGPEVFIPVAEEIDLISELSESLIRQALADARDWHPSLTLSVNISPLQLRDPWFAQKLLHLLVESGFPSGRLEIEITESCLHENISAVRTIISSLRNQGIRVSLDDFGTGYSSLSQLRSLPFDRLKIDRSFVTEMTRDGGSEELVRAIISLGNGLQLPVTAEGIEDVEVLQALQGMGQLKGQGYIYGRPEDADATRRRLEDLGLLAAAAAPLDVGDVVPLAANPQDQNPAMPARNAG